MVDLGDGESRKSESMELDKVVKKTSKVEKVSKALKFNSPTLEILSPRHQRP